MKKIKIFLASSIVEFARERDELELFIRNVSDRFEENYDTKIIPLRCENVDTCMSLNGKQEEFNELIRESEMCFFIFFTRVGEITRQEFDVAFKRFSDSPNHKPQIYVYFKVIPDGVQADESVKDFMKTIDETYKHYYSNFSNIDTIKLRILLNLKMQEMDFVQVEIKGDRCLVDKVDVLSLKNVSEFANSKELAALNSELNAVEDEYMQMKPMYEQGNFSEEFRREYIRVAARRQSLKEMLTSLKSSIFELSLNLSRDEVRGDLTPRQREAYRLLEMGDSKGCLSVLDSNDIDDEFERFERQQEMESKRKAAVYIREHKLAIDVLRTMYDYKERFAEIDKRYEKIVSAALKYQVELGVLYDYAFYYHEQNEYEKALNVAEKYRVFCEDPSYGISDYEKSRLYSIMGRLYRKADKQDISEVYFLRTVQIRETLAAKHSEYKLDLASVYQNTGVIYNDTKQFDKAEKYLLAAQKTYASYTGALQPDNPFVARNFNALGRMYASTLRYDKAEQCYLQSLEFCKKSSQIVPHCFEFYWGVGCQGMGEMYSAMGLLDKAEQRFCEAVSIRQTLTAENPFANEPYLAESILSLAEVYKSKKQLKQAEQQFTLAKEIYSRLAEVFPAKYFEKLQRVSDGLSNLR